MGADEVTDTQPVGWYVRIMFDELLNPDTAETLLDLTGTKPCPFPMDPMATCRGSLATTQPVTITCAGADVPYDGYYDPSGNSFTWPLGPSLFIAPNDTSTIATGTECEVTIKDSDSVKDKDGNHVPTAQLGPYKFKIAPLALLSEDPAQPKDLTKPATIAPSKPLVLTFNATMNVTSLDPTKVTIIDAADCQSAATGTAHTAKVVGDADSKQAIDVQDSGAAGTDAWLHAKTYIVTFPMGIDVKDAGGGAGSFPDANKLTICFKTAP